MTTYEVSNPSDAITCRAPSDEVAILATLVIGAGKYGVRSANGVVLPVLLLATEPETDAELQKRIGYGVKKLAAKIEEHRAEVIACLDSFQIATTAERDAYERALLDQADPAAFRETVRAKKQTSLTEICGTAWALAKGLRQ